MLIPFEKLILSNPITGVIHIGAHECEEREEYLKHFNLDDSKIIWIDALENKVNEMKENYPDIIIYNACISDIDDNLVSFMVANNFQSSSMLNFKTHLEEHPLVYELGRVNLYTKKLDTLIKENNITLNHNFINLDIQGAELLALKGGEKTLEGIDYIYTEINEKELYEGCCLLPELDNYLKDKGFLRILTCMSNCGWGDAFYIRCN